MHELGICDALLKMVRGIMKDEELAGTASCMDCGEEFVADLNDLRCPHCGGRKLMPLTGRDLTLKEILAP